MIKPAHEPIWRQRPWNEISCRSIARTFNIPLEIAAILNQRGITDPSDVEAFLWPKLAHLPSPMLMKGMDDAVRLLTETLGLLQQPGRPVLIYGDYDVDGITGSALLFLFLRSLGVQVQYYIPNRLSEGYGLHAEALTQMYYRHYKDVNGQASNPLLITVDCGITNQHEVQEAKKLGYTVIITDHHQPQSQLPAADAILNPHQPDCSFPFKQLAGVGVVFYLVMGLRSHLKKLGYWSDNDRVLPNLKQYLDLVALGTISDMVPLLGPNRILTMAGLEIIAITPSFGIKVLLEQAEINQGVPTSEDIAFKICPKINAAGRVGEPEIAFRLLITQSLTEALQLATDLEDANNCRKNITNLVYESALVQANCEILKNKTSLVLGSSEWHPGVLGLVATKIMNKYHRPTLIFRFENEIAKGSGRSINGINLNEILGKCREYLISYGGHKSAVGCAMLESNYTLFADEFENEIQKNINRADLQPILWIDFKIQPSELNSEHFMRYYKMLHPFGIGNEEPVFLSKKANKLVQPRQIGKNSLRFVWQEASFSCNGYGFGLGAIVESLKSNQALIAFKLRNNVFRGINRWEIKTEDIRIIPTN